MFAQPWIGLANYRAVLGDDTFWVVFVNSVVYTLITVPGQMAVGLFVALLLNGIRRFSVGFRVINYLPVITSWVIASLVFRYIFNTEGLLNYFLTNITGITAQNVRWLDSRWSGMAVAMLLGIWKAWAGTWWCSWRRSSRCLMTCTRPRRSTAAARGKSSARHAPFHKGTVLFALIMLTIGGFNVFTSIKLITGGKPAHMTDTLRPGCTTRLSAPASSATPRR
jgi:multiple sugar transport system permease protein